MIVTFLNAGTPSESEREKERVNERDIQSLE